MTEKPDLETTREAAKLLHDYLKHLATLSTACILIVTAFLEKFFAQPQWKNLVAVSIISFLVSVVSSVLSLTVNVETMHKDDDPWFAALGIGLIGTWSGFLVGISALTVFAAKNLL